MRHKRNANEARISINTHLPKPIYDAVRRAAREEDISMAAWMRRAIRVALGRQKEAS